MKYCISLLLFCLLTACQTYHGRHTNHYRRSVQNHHVLRHAQQAPTKKDGAPKGPVPSQFKKVVPKNEPFSHYGNPDSYHVDGHTYEVMTSAHGYHARGMASWYGTKFHSKRTSSGEDYNMYALTAAHRTLPLPTYVRVKNLSNGRQAIVKVNDRGPFHSGRVIDLSYAAAAKLGVLPMGTAPVEIEALSLGHASQKHVAKYYLQAGAFSTEARAQALRGRLRRLTPSPVVVEKYQRRYIVRVGPFANKQMTDKLKSTLRRKGISGAFSLLL